MRFLRVVMFLEGTSSTKPYLPMAYKTSTVEKDN